MYNVLFYLADVGAVSWESFVSFFADGVMSEGELKSLFNEIDTHNTKYLSSKNRFKAVTSFLNVLSLISTDLYVQSIVAIVIGAYILMSSFE